MFAVFFKTLRKVMKYLMPELLVTRAESYGVKKLLVDNNSQFNFFIFDSILCLDMGWFESL